MIMPKEPNQDRITEMRAAIIEYPMPEPVAAGRWILETLCNVVVCIKSASSFAGMGYAFVFRNSDAQTILSAVSSLRDLVIGRDPMNTIGVHNDLRAGANFVGAGGPAMSAIGAIDLAMWDLKGKLLDRPVHVLLGSTGTRIPAYASGGSFQKSLDELQRELEGYLARGFKAVKIKLPPDVKEACGRIAGCRSRLPDDVKVLYDSNQQQTYKAAVEIGRCCADHGAYWYEEPLPFWQLSSYADLRRTIPCRLALGETFYGEYAFSEAIRSSAADVLMLNLHKIGGVTAWTRIAGAAALAGIPLSSHTMPELSAHMMSAMPGAEMLEYMEDSRPLFDNAFPVEDGCLLISPDEPGFGLQPSRLVRKALGLD
jgi:L-alanine-DL-glutamate epimerase-like enolase superfamily enzyme